MSALPSAAAGIMTRRTVRSPGLSANESNAISTMRNLFTSQAQFMTSANVDEDQDGGGEYGSFGELSGFTNLVRNGVGVAAPLNPPLLPVTFQTITAQGFATKSGYFFAVYLPNAAATGVRDVAGGGERCVARAVGLSSGARTAVPGPLSPRG